MAGQTDEQQVDNDNSNAEDAPEQSSMSIPVVGIGSSAGGLDPLKRLLAELPVDSGMAFVIIQHLSPTAPSMLSDILTSQTSMPVAQVQQDTAIQADHVYVIAPNTYLALHDGRLRVTPPIKQDHWQMPVDFLLRSLADSIGELAVGIILSGTQSDGTLGVRSIRGAGGLVIAQEPTTAQYADMPRNAIATGLVDLVLPVEEMGEALKKHSRQPQLHIEAHEEQAAELSPEMLEPLLEAIQERNNSDFRWYKKTTIARRVKRRMNLRGIDSFDDYVRLVREDQQEMHQLLKDLLIGVTSFFRDSKSFEELRRLVIKPLVEQSKGNEAIRVWIAGCGSGEEAYSVAMLLLEEMEAAGRKLKLQIFGSDLDEESLHVARLGIYPSSISADLTPQRLERFFNQGEGTYQVNKELRECVVFAAHNLVADPPFCRMNLITCRNLLIYLEGEVQRKVITLFNFALRRDGHLFLGKAESTGNQAELFETVNATARIFRRLEAPRHTGLDLPVYSGGKATSRAQAASAQRDQNTIGDLLKGMLTAHFGTAVVMIDRNGQILQYLGNLDRYVTVSGGQPIMNLLEMAREGLSARLRPAVRKVVENKTTETLTRVPVKQGEDSIFVNATVMPVAYRGGPDDLVAVLLERTHEVRPETTTAGHGENESVIKQLEDELRLAQEDLRSTVTELQAANDDMKVANEEATSMNEELQSSNEELETSKEELQSINEELTTVNAELQEKIEKLAAANNDMKNLLSSTAIATIFLDDEQRIRFITPPAGDLLNLIPDDRGRPIGHFSHNLLGLDLAGEAQDVLSGGNSLEREVAHRDGRWFLMRIMPYQSEREARTGVIVTFTDITQFIIADDLKRSNRDLEQFAYVASHDLQEPLRMVTGFMDLLVQGYQDKLDEKAREYIAFASDGATRMRRLIDDLLEYSRVESRGRRPHQTDANRAYERALADLRAQIDESKANVICDPLPQVLADETQLTQLLVNLIGNAVKFAGTNNPPQVHVGAKQNDGGQWQFSIRDNGIGIDPRQFKRIFNVFTRLHTREHYTGSGIGLAICKKIVERHGGQIWVESEKGAGSTFYFTLHPVPKEEMPHNQQQQQ